MTREDPPLSPANPVEDLETFLRRQDPADLVAVLLELAETHESVRARLERMLLADRPGKLAADFKNTLSRWKRSRKFYQYREAREFARTLSGWLDQVARELLPRDAAAALALFEAFIEADATWFEHADDSDGVIGEAVREACRYWLQAAARCESSPAAWSQRMVDLYATDGYGAREELLRRADLLFDESALRELVARFDSRLEKTLDAIPDGEKPSSTVFRLAAALSLLAEALRDPDIMVRATLRYRPDPNSVQRQKFAEAYLQAGRPADAIPWLRDPWEHIDQRRQDLLAEALERLGRFDESLPMRRRMFEGSPTAFNFQRWFAHVPDPERAAAVAHAHEVALRHDDEATAAMLLLHLGNAPAAEAKLMAGHARVDGTHYAGLLPLAEALRANECPRGETVVLRALLTDILNRANGRAYGHAARYWVRLSRIADSGVDLQPLPTHEEFAAEIRAQHKRKSAFWARVHRVRLDGHDGAEEVGS